MFLIVLQKQISQNINRTYVNVNVPLTVENLI